MKIRILLASTILVISSLLSNKPTYLKTNAKTMEFNESSNRLITVDACTKKITRKDEKPIPKINTTGNIEMINGKKPILVQKLPASNSELLCKIWDIETGKLIEEYNSTNELGNVCISKEGLVANLIVKDSKPQLTIYDVQHKQPVKTIKPNIEIGENNSIYITDFFGNTVYLSGQTGNGLNIKNFTRAFNIQTGAEEQNYPLFLDSINSVQTYGFIAPVIPIPPLIIYDLVNKEMVYKHKTLVSSSACWLNDNVFVRNPYEWNIANSMSIEAQDTQGNIICAYDMSGKPNIEILGRQNDEYVLSSNEKHIIQSWNMLKKESCKNIINVEESAAELKTIKEGMLAAALLKNKIVLFDPKKTYNQLNGCCLN